MTTADEASEYLRSEGLDPEQLAKEGLIFIKTVKEKIKLEKLVLVQKQYIKLLGDELDTLVSIASVHGWRSTRFEEGKNLREFISIIESDLEL